MAQACRMVSRGAPGKAALAGDEERRLTAQEIGSCEVDQGPALEGPGTACTRFRSLRRAAVCSSALCNSASSSDPFLIACELKAPDRASSVSPPVLVFPLNLTCMFPSRQLRGADLTIW